METVKTHDGWYYISGPKATFTLEVRGNKVVQVAPYGRPWLLGMNAQEMIDYLHEGGYTVIVPQ